MQQRNFYDSVHYREYLDGGCFDPPTGTITDTNHIEPRSRQLSVNSKTTRSSILKNDTPRYWYVRQLSGLCKKYLDAEVLEATFPGGEHRNSCRLHLEDGRSVIATRRDAPGRARLEQKVLSTLINVNSSVPEPLAFNGIVLLQEDVQGERVSDLLMNATADEYACVMKKSLLSIHGIHQDAVETDLRECVPCMGVDTRWITGLLDRTAVIGGYLNVPCPPIDITPMSDLLLLTDRHFIKWDARPGNALWTGKNEVIWFDWEHCCLRHPIDDMVWLMCDDTVPNYPDIEADLIEQFLPLFAFGKEMDEAYNYLRVFGVHHMCVRLGRLLNEKGNDSWDSLDQRIRYGISGLAQKEALRLCARAAHWSDTVSFTQPLVGWFNNIEQKLIQ